MGDHTAITWTEATWNPVTGCSHVSEGCRFCYAEAVSLRRGWSTKPWTAQNAAENVVLHPERLGQPAKWRRPRRIFVNSMSDLFHERVPDAFIEEVFRVMRDEIRHTFQVLTKRPERMRDFVRSHWGDAVAFWDHVWLGVSAEDQRAWDERVEVLGETPAAVRFVSAEPLLGWIDVGNALDPGGDGFDPVDWVIIGGETGPAHREMDLKAAWWLAEQCELAEVPCFVKQDSGRWPGHQGRLAPELWARKEYPIARRRVVRR